MARTKSETSYRRPIGFFEAKFAAKTLRRYLDMIRLDNFVHFHDEEERRALRKGYPQYFQSKKPKMPIYPKVSKEISKLTVIALYVLQRIDAPTDWSSESEEVEFDFNKGKNVQKSKREDYNLIADRQIPVISNKKGFNDSDTTYPILEQSIAYYEHITRNYWKKWINPLWWLAFVLRLPISLLEYMGLDTRTENLNRFIYWFFQALVAAILSLVLVKLGVSLNISIL